MNAGHDFTIMARCELPEFAPAIGEDGGDLCIYRDRVIALVRRYARASVEVGRLPSLLGRECFRSRVTSYSMTSFEDIVIFVHDVERALTRLSAFHQKLIAMVVIEQFCMPEVARLVRCPLRTLEREFPDALDLLARMFLEGGLLDEVRGNTSHANSCQEGKNYNFEASDSKQGKNIF
jgi:hypothetical protein